MDLSTQDINSVANLAMGNSRQGRIKGTYIDLAGDEMQVKAVVNVIGIDFFVNVKLKPHMADKDIVFMVDSVTVGKLPIPNGIAVSLLKSYLPGNFKVVDGNSIDIGNKVLMFDIKDLSVSGSSMRVELLKDAPALVVNDKGEVTVSEGGSTEAPAKDAQTSGTESTQTPGTKDTSQGNTSGGDSSKGGSGDSQSTSPSQGGDS